MRLRRVIPGIALILFGLLNFVLGLAGRSLVKAQFCIQRPDVADPCSGLYPIAEFVVMLGFFLGVYLLFTGAGDLLEA